MAREDPHFRLRIPERLKNQVERAASENHRSITAEIVARLERSFMTLQELEKADLAEEIRALRQRLDQLDGSIEAPKGMRAKASPKS